MGHYKFVRHGLWICYHLIHSVRIVSVARNTKTAMDWHFQIEGQIYIHFYLSFIFV
jgi:hypothetical protein